MSATQTKGNGMERVTAICKRFELKGIKCFYTGEKSYVDAVQTDSGFYVGINAATFQEINPDYFIKFDERYKAIDYAGASSDQRTKAFKELKELAN